MVSYLAFDRGPGELTRAVLELHGSSADGAPLTFAVYAIGDTSWAGQPLGWETAPYLDGSAVRATGVGEKTFPAGQATAPGAPGPVRLDVTDAVLAASGHSVGFLLVREARTVTDTADDGRRADLASVVSADAALRPVLHIWT